MVYFFYVSVFFFSLLHIPNYDVECPDNIFADDKKPADLIHKMQALNYHLLNMLL